MGSECKWRCSQKETEKHEKKKLHLGGPPAVIDKNRAWIFEAFEAFNKDWCVLWFLEIKFI